MATEWKEPFCPMCGRGMGMRTVYKVPKKPHMGIERRENLWEKTKDFHGEKPFGVVKVSQGKGTMKMLRYYDLDEDTEGYFPWMKRRLIAIISEWLAKGWLTKNELENL